MSKRILPALRGGASPAAPGGAGRGEATAKTTSADRETQLLKFAQCMRDHGVDVPDPKTDSKGNLMLQRPGRIANGNGPPTQAERSKFESARKACAKYSPFQQLTPEQRAQFQDNALKFAQCMRSKGFDVPDPNFSQAPSSGRERDRFFGGNINPRDPKVRTALDACRQKTFGSQGGPGIGFSAPLRSG
jgi:hypothetical protein